MQVIVRVPRKFARNCGKIKTDTKQTNKNTILYLCDAAISALRVEKYICGASAGIGDHAEHIALAQRVVFFVVGCCCRTP